MISKDIKEKLNSIFSERLKKKVVIEIDRNDTKLSQDVENLINEIAETSDLIEVVKGHFSDLKPCVLVKSEDFDRFRYYGLPSGGEFQTFIEAIIMISSGEVKLDDRTAEFAKDIDEPVDIKLFITKSCGWCPPTIKQALSFAILNKNISVSVFDCFDFPEEAQKYSVSTVPKIVINDKVEFVGHRRDNEFLGHIFSAVGK